MALLIAPACASRHGRDKSDGAIADDDGGADSALPGGNDSGQGGGGDEHSGADSAIDTGETWIPTGPPTAIFNCPAAPEWGTGAMPLNGLASDEAWPGPSLTYWWSRVESPGEQAGNFWNPQDPTTETVVNLVGSYVFSLVVTDSVAGPSDPAYCAVEVESPAALLVELTWDYDSRLDLDLHLIRGAGTIGDPGEDACWETAGNLDWGEPGSDEGEAVVSDSRRGTGPDSTWLDAVEEGMSYSIVAIGYDRPDDSYEKVDAMVRVWVGGELLAEEHGTLGLSDAWLVGTVTPSLVIWAPDGTVIGR